MYKANILQKMLKCVCSPCLPLSDFRVNGYNVAIERAPEPDDIIWENACVTVSQSIRRRSVINFCCLLLLIAGGAGQYGLALFQNSL